MIELGKKQTLEVVKKVEFGVYLAEEAASTDKTPCIHGFVMFPRIVSLQLPMNQN